MFRNNQIDFWAIQMLLLLEKFKNKANDIEGIPKLFFLTALMSFPNKLNEKLFELNEELITFPSYYESNVELEVIKRRIFFNLSEYYCSFGRLLSKKLVKTELKNNKLIISITCEGLDLIKKLDYLEWHFQEKLAKTIKQNFGDKTFLKLKSEFTNILPVEYIQLK